MTTNSGRFRKKDYRYFQMAKEQAMQSTYDRVAVGCILVYKNHVIGAGFNNKKTCPQQKRANKKRNFNHNSNRPINHYMHAEISALRSVPYTVAQSICWRNVDVYVYRISPGHSLGMGLSRPCAGCMSELTNLGIKNIFYSGNNGFVYEEIY